MGHPYADLICFNIDEQENGHSQCSLVVRDELFNPHGVLHGAAIYSLADTGMGAALYPSLEDGQICATIEIKTSYFKPVVSGTVVCITRVVNRGRTVANLDSEIFCCDRLVAKASGNYAIFKL